MALVNNRGNQNSASMLSVSRLTVLTIVSIGSFLGTVISAGQVAQKVQPDVEWRTGNLDKFNQLGISVWWSGAKLRERMMRFSRNQGLAVFLDRRIDPSTQIELSLQDVTKEQFFWTVAGNSQMGVCRVEDFYYFGPFESAAILPTAYQQLRKTTSKQRKTSKVDWNDRQPLKTDDIVQPKQLLMDLAAKNQFKIKNLDSIPHDVWAGFELPKTSLQARVAILLFGFEKTFARNVDGTEIEIVDLPDIQSAESSFRNLDNAAGLARELRRSFPDLSISVNGKKRLVVKGDPIDVAKAKIQVVAAQNVNGVKTENQPFNITTRASRGDVLATVAKLTKTVLVFDKSNSSIANSLMEQIEVRAKSLDELLQQALAGSNLKHEQAEGQLRITVQTP